MEKLCESSFLKINNFVTVFQGPSFLQNRILVKGLISVKGVCPFTHADFDYNSIITMCRTTRGIYFYFLQNSSDKITKREIAALNRVFILNVTRPKDKEAEFCLPKNC